jgi:predicted protein tyrosine phosphatase
MFNPLRTIIIGPVMNFQVLSRANVATVIPELPHLLISITDVNSEEAILADAPNRLGVLRLQFADSDEGGETLSPEMATRIVAAVRQDQESIKLVVCHCEAGVSRSAGVAAALSRWLNDDDKVFYAHFYPNSHVYRTVLNAAMAEETAKEK